MKNIGGMMSIEHHQFYDAFSSKLNHTLAIAKKIAEKTGYAERENFSDINHIACALLRYDLHTHSEEVKEMLTLGITVAKVQLKDIAAEDCYLDEALRLGIALAHIRLHYVMLK